jgi:hypothetical protein
MAHQLGLAFQPPPMPLPDFEVVQIWHRRFAADPRHIWLCSQIAAVATPSVSSLTGVVRNV